MLIIHFRAVPDYSLISLHNFSIIVNQFGGAKSRRFFFLITKLQTILISICILTRIFDGKRCTLMCNLIFLCKIEDQIDLKYEVRKVNDRIFIYS